MASLDSLRPIRATAGACSQSPECAATAAGSLALSTSLGALERIKLSWLTATNLSQAFWMCLTTLIGMDAPEGEREKEREREWTSRSSQTQLTGLPRP